jgi:hypothetical protein
MIGMGMGADDQIDIVCFQSQILQAPLNVVEQGPVTGVDQYPARAINKIGIAIISGH